MIRLQGTMNLGGANLQVAAPQPISRKDPFTLLQNSGTTPVTGFFQQNGATLKQGGKILIGGFKFHIHYNYKGKVSRHNLRSITITH